MFDQLLSIALANPILTVGTVVLVGLVWFVAQAARPIGRL